MINHIFSLLKDIETGKTKIEMLPNQDLWMGNIVYNIENGWKIIIFSDCFCWDYIDSILDENNNIIYKYHPESPISEYYCPDEVSKNIYKIFDPIKK